MLKTTRSIQFLILLAVTAGIGQTQTAKPASTAKTASKPAGQSRNRTAPGHSALSDADIEKEIRARFAQSKINADKFEVHVQGGRAVITGKTNILQHKGVATRMARAAGAIDVVNNIEPSEEAIEKATGNLTKGRRRVQVKRGDARSESR